MNKQNSDWAEFLKENSDRFPSTFSVEEVFLVWFFHDFLESNGRAIKPGYEGEAIMHTIPLIKDAPEFTSSLDVEKYLIELDKKQAIRYNPIPPGTTIH